MNELPPSEPAGRPIVSSKLISTLHFPACATSAAPNAAQLRRPAASGGARATCTKTTVIMVTARTRRRTLPSRRAASSSGRSGRAAITWRTPTPRRRPCEWPRDLTTAEGGRDYIFPTGAGKGISRHVVICVISWLISCLSFDQLHIHIYDVLNVALL